MKGMNKKFIILLISIFTLIAGTSVYANDTVSSLFPTISSEHQDDAKKVQDLLTQSWAKGKEKLQGSAEVKAFINSSKSKDQDLSNWTFIDATKLDKLLSSFSKQEQSSFLDAFYSKERKENLEKGDYMSALLLSPDKSQALVYWEKANGTYVVLEMNTKSGNSWYVSEVVKIESSK